MKKRTNTQITQQNDKQLPNECKGAIKRLTEQIETKNFRGRLDTQEHLDALGLECEIDGNGQTTKGRRSKPVKQGSKTLKQMKKQDKNHRSISEGSKHRKP